MNLLWKLAIVLSVAVAFFAISRNGDDINQVCSTVQRQVDRNAATVERGLRGLEMIRDHPLSARAQSIPGSAYYVGHPIELAAAIQRSKRELATYQVKAC